MAMAGSSKASPRAKRMPLAVGLPSSSRSPIATSSSRHSWSKKFLLVKQSLAASSTLLPRAGFTLSALLRTWRIGWVSMSSGSVEEDFVVRRSYFRLAFVTVGKTRIVASSAGALAFLMPSPRTRRST